MADAYDRSSERGVELNLRTLEMLTIAERDTGFQVTLTQGSYNGGAKKVKESAGTHDGGGALDVRAKDLSTTQRKAVVTCLRRIGFAAWIRNPDQGDWPWHIHAIAIGDRELSTGAAKQVKAYKKGKNGLKSTGNDDGPHVAWDEYPQMLQEGNVLSDNDKVFLRNLVAGIDRNVRVVGRDPSGVQVANAITLGGRLLLLQDDTDDIQRRLSRISAAIGQVDDRVIAGLTARVAPMIVAELSKLPPGTALTREQVGEAVSAALRESFGG